MLCAENINVIVDAEAWVNGHVFEENFSDTDNSELDGTFTDINLVNPLLALTEQKTLFEVNSKNTLLSSGFIRAPPKYLS
jgi:hypothetical protein